MNGQTVLAEIILLFCGILDLLCVLRMGRKVTAQLHLPLVALLFYVTIILMRCWQWSVTVGDVRLIALRLYPPSAFRSNSVLVHFPTLLEPSILIPFHPALLPESYSAQ